MESALKIRTSLDEARISDEDAVRSYKQLTLVERAFRSMKTMDLQLRPIHHRLEGRVRAHIFLCMLVYYVQWHMMDVWRELSFADEDQGARATRDPVAPVGRCVTQGANACLRTAPSRIASGRC